MKQVWQNAVLGFLVGCGISLLWCVLAHAEVHRLGDCAVFPPAPVHVIHRPHHFAHHRAPVCHCDEQLGGPAGGGASSDGFSSNYGGSGDGFYQDDAGGVADGSGDNPPMGVAGDFLFVGIPGLLDDVRIGFLGEGNGSPGGPDSPTPTVIPEPSTLALVVIGAGALLLKWRVS